MQFWSTFEEKNFVQTSKNDKLQSKKCQKCIPFLESTYHEMQRKHLPESVVNRLMIDIKHQPDAVLVAI